MGGNLEVGFGLMALCVVIQVVVVSVLLRMLQALERKHVGRPTFWEIASVLVLVLTVMLAGNMLQIAIWAVVFVEQGEFETFGPAFYHSMVNFTTLGYGDVVMSERRRLLGALEATNGVLMFGLTTSVLFATLQALLRRVPQQDEGAHESRGPRPGH